MDGDKAWGECVIHDQAPAVAVHWCRPIFHLGTPISIPTMWRLCQRCHELAIRRRWSLLVTHAVDEVRAHLPQIGEPAPYEEAMAIVAFMAGRTGAWTHSDGSHGSTAPPEPMRGPKTDGPESWMRR